MSNHLQEPKPLQPPLLARYLLASRFPSTERQDSGVIPGLQARTLLAFLGVVTVISSSAIELQ